MTKFCLWCDQWFDPDWYYCEQCLEIFHNVVRRIRRHSNYWEMFAK